MMEFLFNCSNQTQNFNPKIDEINSILGNKSFVEKLGRNPNIYDNENLRIRIHLEYVSKLLKSKYKGNEKFKIISEYLDEYIETEKFPKNDELSFRNPIFIDKNGNYCAVGYLIMKTLGKEICREIDESFHFSYINDIKSDVLEKWIESYGMELIDLQMIQPGYTPSAISFLTFFYLLGFTIPFFVCNCLIFSSIFKYSLGIDTIQATLLFIFSLINSIICMIHGLIILFNLRNDWMRNVMILNLFIGVIALPSLSFIVFFYFGYFYGLGHIFQIINCLILILYVIIATVFSIIGSRNVRGIMKKDELSEEINDDDDKEKYNNSLKKENIEEIPNYETTNNKK